MASNQDSPRPWLRATVRGLALCIAVALSLGSVAAPAMAQDASEPPADGIALPEGFDRRMARRVANVIETVPAVRRLPAAEGVAYRIIDPDSFAEELERLFREEYSDDYIEAEENALKRLGLLEADVDLERLILGLYDSQVLAYYDPRTTTFTLIGPIDSIGALEKTVVVHEYGHAMQDAEWDLEASRIRDLDRADAILAQQALIEGDATALMYDWVERELSFADLLAVSAQALTQQDSRRLGRMPDLLRRQLEFPYLDGYAFVNAIRGEGGWAAVDDLWDAPPVSTEQILHPELYPDELPVEVVLPDIAAALGPGWVDSYYQTLGEMQTHVWVADDRRPRQLFPVLPAVLPRAEAAAGWGGDRLVSLDGPDGAWAVVWQTDWDTAVDQDEFRKAARDAVKDLPGSQRIVDADVAGGLSSPVLVLLADGDGTLSAVEAALGLDA